MQQQFFPLLPSENGSCCYGWQWTQARLVFDNSNPGPWSQSSYWVFKSCHSDSYCLVNHL